MEGLKQMDIADAAVVAKNIRGQILKLLYFRQCDKVTVSMIRGLLRYKNYSSEKAVEQAIRYLAGEGKRYILVEINDNDFEDSLVEISPTGIDLMENENEKRDIGVNINE